MWISATLLVALLAITELRPVAARIRPPVLRPGPPLIDQAGTQKAIRDYQAQAVPAREPPEFLIDLLGRRSLCLRLQSSNGDKPPVENADGEEWIARGCGTVAAEEAALRKAHREEPDVLLWLDQDSRKFKLGGVRVTFDGPRSVDAHRVEQAGVDPLTNIAFRVRLESDATKGLTRVTAQIGKVSRTILISDRRYPGLDQNSLRVGFGPRTRTEYLTFELHYGFDRPYCWEGKDTRPSLSIHVSRDGSLAGYRQQNINCSLDAEELASSDFPVLD